MSDDNSTSIINLGDLAKPAIILIEKVSDAIGGIFKPAQIERIAKAEAKAFIIKAKSEIRVSDLRERAANRLVNEEITKQKNIEDIIRLAIPLLNSNAKPEELDEDWIVNLFNKARYFSDDEMQLLWAKILSGQANEPDCFSRKTVNLVNDLSKSDAEFFCDICRFVWRIDDDFYPIVFDYNSRIYKQFDIKYSNLSHLGDMGLISIGVGGEFCVTDLSSNLLSYFGRDITINLDKAIHRFEIGVVTFTKAGRELFNVVHPKELRGFFEYTIKKWKQYDAKPVPKK